MRVSSRSFRLFEVKEGSEDRELGAEECLWAVMANWKDTRKLLFKKSALSNEGEAEAPKTDGSDDDEISLVSIDGEVVIFYGDNHIGLSLDGETSTKVVLEQMLGILNEDVATIAKYAIFEVHDSGKLRPLPLDECPLITKLNSLESFKFELRKKEEKAQEDEIDPLRMSVDQDPALIKRNAAKKRTDKLAGFFGLENSKSEVADLKYMLGNEVGDSLKFTKRQSIIRRGINREGWLQVRRDFEDLGKARWQQCWCILNKGDLTICLGQMVSLSSYLVLQPSLQTLFSLPL